MISLKLVCVVTLTIASIASLPIDIKNVRQNVDVISDVNIEDNNAIFVEEAVYKVDNTVNIKYKANEIDSNASNNVTMRNQIRPGMQVARYSVEITPNVNSGTFSGTLTAQVAITEPATREDPVMFYTTDLEIDSVTFSLGGGSAFSPADFNFDDDGNLEIDTGFEATLYTFIIEYRGSLSISGHGLYTGSYDTSDYIAMNLHPTNARRVFPCMDEPTEASIISFTFNNLNGYNHLISNSQLQDNSDNQFRALQGPPHLWSMFAHNLNNINVPTSGVFLFIRPGVSNQENQAAVAMNYYFNTLNEWTNKPYFEIILDQSTQLSILALPDVSKDWYGLSTVALWEPYVLMETTCSVKQRYTGLVKMAEALAQQWFGYVVFPENWRYNWVVSGLATYTAFDVLSEFQSNPTGTDISLLDTNTLFVTEVIQESLYHDGYTAAHTLEQPEDLFEEVDIRDYIYGVQKYKAPALFRMMKIILGDQNQDFIQSAGRALLAARSLQTVNSAHFVDAINSDWLSNGNGRVPDIAEYMEPWLETQGYPIMHVGLRQGGITVTQERFGYSNPPYVAYNVPLTYTISSNPNYEMDNVYTITMMEGGSMPFNMFLDEEEGDYVLFNIQGQGYYRVNYDDILWERITEALDDPDRRAEIHPLNRATLIDDALNLARAGRIDYGIAFEVVLTMVHETEYAPWRAFIRNMNFLKKRLEALVFDDDDLDPDIYLRMVRRAIVTFEQEIGFSPDPLISEPVMTSLTRGMVMDHVCRAGYQPCIAAAVDWFYDSNNDGVVNPNIPSDLRPAVYCAMVREGGADVIDALNNRLEIEVSMWERVVILESMACSNDQAFVNDLLTSTIAANSPYSVAERMNIFKAVAESSYQNAALALSFLRLRTHEVRDMYGGDGKVEEAIYALVENMADADLSGDFEIWANAQNNNLDDSQSVADRTYEIVLENRAWDNRHLDYVYEWIDENDAPTLVVSLVLISISFMIAVFNH